MPRHLLFVLALAATLVTGPSARSQGTPIGFAEDWALATDRAKALEQLIPATRDYYYYYCRYYQDTGAFDKVEPLLRAWVQRHGRTRRVIEIENRQALLTFDKNPDKTMRFLKGRLGLRFDHQREKTGAKQDLPTELDQSLISPEAFTRRAMQKYPRSANGFNDSAFPALLASRLGDDMLMSVLSRLSRPDYPNLPALIVRNLGDRRSRGFGSLGIHRQLLLDQLEECVRLRPTLINEPAFVQIYLRRLEPNADVQWQHDPEARKAYLDRLYEFAQRLSSAHNSLKAHVLAARLRFDLAAGKPNKARFMAYLRLPRMASYVNPTYLRRYRRSGEIVDTNRSFATSLQRIGNDEPLVRAYLMHFFRTEDSYQPYTETVRSDYLRRVFAETKILYGIGDMERWYSLLNDPAYYERLKERVEIEFAPTQHRHYAVNDPVAIDVDVKNVKKLLVKVFEIHAFNYYKQLGREVDASINLDGLVANHELTREYTESPLRRVRRHFDLPQLTEPGVYVVELIGNGLSSRAVIHKGQLQYTERLGAAGHVFTIRDEAGRKRTKASIWFGGKQYDADEDGEIAIPYSTKPGRRMLILQSSGHSSIAWFQHLAERYSLTAGIHLDRESLVSSHKARILIRPSLRLNQRPISLEALESPVLTIRSRDRNGVESSLEVRNFKLFADRESVREIQVPKNLASLSVSLHGKVQSLSRGKPEELSAGTRTFLVNDIDATPRTACPLLGHTAAGYMLDLLGKNGEPKVGRAVRLRLTHRDYTVPFNVTLKTDERGRIRLGALEGITTIKALDLPAKVGLWTLPEAKRTYPSEVHGIVGETLRVPYLGRAQATSRSAVSLLEVRHGQYVRDAIDNVSIAGGFIEMKGLAAGDYRLWLEEAAVGINVRVTAGAYRDGWAVGRDRLLEARRHAPLQIKSVAMRGKDLRVELANAGKDARVHVVATRYLEPFDPFADLVTPTTTWAGVVPVEHSESSYHSGREIGDEYRYILDRRFAKKYPGNMLDRPGLILNPWALSEDASRTMVGLGGGAGGQFGGRAGGRRAGPTTGRRQGQAQRGLEPGTFANLEFLAQPSVIAANLRADANGVVSVPIGELGSGQQIHVVAVDSVSTVYETLALDERPLDARNRELTNALDSKRHFTEQRQIEFLDKGGKAVLEDRARAETYDSLASVYRLFSTLSGNADLAKFAFVLDWPQLDAAKKRELYEDHACHELHFFLYHKDPQFFEEVVKPYLANKLHKTFLDDWLLDADLHKYLDPWAFSRLNIVEQILLAQRLGDAAPSIRRHVKELFELRPSDPAELNRLFDSTLQSGALDKLSGFKAKLEELKELQNERRKRQSRAPKPAAPQTRARRRTEAGRPARPTADAKRALDKNADRELDEIESEKEPAEAPRDAPDAAKDLRRDMLRRKSATELYREPDPTRAYVEDNYWHKKNVEQNGSLIEVNGFWHDYAFAAKDRPFVSTHIAQATNSFAEMMMALAVLDLPFKPGTQDTQVADGKVTLTAGSPLLLVRKEVVETGEVAKGESPILVSQNYYRLDEPYRYEGNQRLDAYITGEFLVDVAYGCRVVITNPSSTPRELDLLLQIPEGAVPVKDGFYTRGVRVALGAYATSSIDYAFYFPAAGSEPHYPVQVSRAGKLVAYAAARSLDVVPEPSKVDTSSWQFVSQNASNEQVLQYLDSHNLQRTELDKIAWRMHDREMFEKVVDLLRSRHAYSDVLWSYGIRHDDAKVTGEYLRHQDRFLNACGLALESPLVTIDPVVRNTYQQIEYSPLFNARAHQFGKRREILNPHLARQYLRFLRVLGERRQLDDADWMSVTYYLLLQDRIGDALASFARVSPDRLPMRIQYDYMRAYLDFFTPGTAVAREIAERYRNYPATRWQKLFANVRSQLAEVEGADVAQVNPKNREQRQVAIAEKQPALDLDVEARRVTIRYKNVESVEIRYYEMDVEFLFSTHPFVQQGSGSFAFIQPNYSETRQLMPGKTELTFDLPQQFLNSNVLIEVQGGGITRRKAYYANSLAVQWVENYGQLKVTQAKTGKPLPAVYVKVFARMPGGQVRFYKDGYTDLRGRFDYTSLSAKEARGAQRFAVLVLSDEQGAVIREVAPPTQ